MSQFYTPWKRQKTYGFQGVEKCDIGLKWVKGEWKISLAQILIKLETWSLSMNDSEDIPDFLAILGIVILIKRVLIKKETVDMTKIYNWMQFLTPTQYGEEGKYSYRGIAYR